MPSTRRMSATVHLLLAYVLPIQLKSPPDIALLAPLGITKKREESPPVGGLPQATLLKGLSRTVCI